MTVSNDTLVKVVDLKKHFGDILALNGVSFSIKRNEVVALLGENGAGKSTCINTLLGRISADTGQAQVFDLQPGNLAAKQRIGVMLQSAALPDNLTVFEQLRLFASYYPHRRALDDVIATAMLDGFEQRKIQGLSGGQKQRLLFAMAIVGNPELVVLDEPTVGLDVSARRQFWTCIRHLAEQGVSVLLTTHYLEEADALSDRVLVLSQGQILAQGTPQSIKNQLGGKHVTFQCAASPDQLEALFPHLSMSWDGQYVSILTTKPESVLAGLFEQHIQITDLTVVAVSLEEAFLSLTRKHNSSRLSQKEQAA